MNAIHSEKEPIMSNPLIYFAQHPIFETKRLILRPLQLTDLEDYYEYVSDDVLLNYDFPASETKEEALEGLVVYNLAQPLGRYALELKTTGKMIGHFSLRLDVSQTNIEIGYVVNRLFHNQGLASEALTALIDFIDTIPTIEKSMATVDHQNIVSHKLLLKAGFVQVATDDQAESLRGFSTINFLFERKKKL